MTDAHRATPPPTALAAAYFALGIRARRDVLSTLFYAVKNSAAEAWAFHLRIQEREEPRQGGMVAIKAGNVMPRQALIDAKGEAEATAQDSAWALVLIADYAIQRLRSGIGDRDTRDIGADADRGVKFNRVVWALAAQARHAHTWLDRPDDQLFAQEDAQTIRTLGHDPRNPNAAREIIAGMPGVNSYVDLEDKLLATAHELLVGTGWFLAYVTGGSFLLDIDRGANG